jgi:flavorubredoxin
MCDGDHLPSRGQMMLCFAPNDVSKHQGEFAMITNGDSATTIDEIAGGIYRISTPVTVVPGGFTFNQYLITGEQPLLFHTGPRRMFPLVREAIRAVLPVEKLRYISFSHYEADECGALNEFLAVSPNAVPLCGSIAALVSIGDVADRAPRALADNERLSLGTYTVRWFDTPHLPHAWECGFLMEETTSTLLCGDLFTQGGADHPAITESDILEPSEAFRAAMDYYSHTKNAKQMIERLARMEPKILACMHGAAWRGDGSALLRELGKRLDNS